MSKVPEFWGRDSPYHGGTEFLGTPSDHLKVRRRENIGRERQRERESREQSEEKKLT